jgi:endogenous inhibitor of DNA gyrase (YacG/DUF329 family)
MSEKMVDIICRQCGQPGKARPSNVKMGRGIYCSRKCRSLDLPARIRAGTTQAEGADCLLWRGQLDDDGYGRISVEGKTRMVHRIAWELAAGAAIPAGLKVLHHCDVRHCCHPAHLFLGTTQDNIGERHGRHKLTENDVREILKSYSPRIITQRHLAKLYGVTSNVIHQIVHKLTWKHVTSAGVLPAPEAFSKMNGESK